MAAVLAGCGTVAKRGPPASQAPRGGGYYLDDGPGDNPPADIDSIPDATPRLEPLRQSASRPYTVMGRNYTPMTRLAPYKARGIASWYGRRYHGKMTSSGEIYDMYGMSAAHTTLPIPSYARVTNVANGKSVVVRINDRGPFVDQRLIDLSYTAAHKLGVLGGGSAMVEVESILPGDSAPPAMASATPGQPAPDAAGADSNAADPRESGVAAASPPAANAQAAAAPTMPVIRDASGLYLQLGAFGSRENAENYLARLRAQSDWLAQTLHMFPKDGLFRVHAGPYANQAEARQAADRISQSLGIKPVLLVR
ncbi:MAG TPA: septal ring lytic transglycosylase RlpA family protein [Burkholderiales bacterium]|nr:septal ring lytic transglycosylase RlpA family protein [Burkholderiales bacterium]